MLVIRSLHLQAICHGESKPSNRQLCNCPKNIASRIMGLPYDTSNNRTRICLLIMPTGPSLLRSQPQQVCIICSHRKLRDGTDQKGVGMVDMAMVSTARNLKAAGRRTPVRKAVMRMQKARANRRRAETRANNQTMQEARERKTIHRTPLMMKRKW